MDTNRSDNMMHGSTFNRHRQKNKTEPIKHIKAYNTKKKKKMQKYGQKNQWNSSFWDFSEKNYIYISLQIDYTKLLLLKTNGFDENLGLCFVVIIDVDDNDELFNSIIDSNFLSILDKKDWKFLFHIIDCIWMIWIDTNYIYDHKMHAKLMEI